MPASRALARLENKGLAPDLIDIDAIESVIKQNDDLGIEIIDEEIDRLIAIDQESSCSTIKASTKRRAAQTAANTEVCTAAVNSVVATLAPLATGTQNNFVVSMKVYLRSAIAYFL
ncbi:putative eka-like protein [Erysiphe necator]|uniref:Putative eka-like protein n=1 Tax=Uncinula necator TaxID=52586 RepID=A0A0B1P4V7_UNCNE|nr:putative eka-like protein [Erysiphe necator]